MAKTLEMKPSVSLTEHCPWGRAVMGLWPSPVQLPKQGTLHKSLPQAVDNKPHIGELLGSGE